MMRLVAFLLVFACASLSSAAQPRGDAAAVAAAGRVLEQAGGAEAWRKGTFEATERVFLRSGETADLRIVRDFKKMTRQIERRSPSTTFKEWVAPGGGWSERNGTRTEMPATELAAELYGLKQEPYFIYHRLATVPSELRVELRDDGASLFVFDKDERLLCWFRLAQNGTMRGWGNFYDGAINEHYYGPVADMGDANLPRWGAAANGGFRFEYLRAKLTD
jgi:hypothetical protein